jgi:hypothetical protein
LSGFFLSYLAGCGCEGQAGQFISGHGARPACLSSSPIDCEDIVAISPELEERVRQAWLESIPAQFRLTNQDKGLISDRFMSSAIIAAPPPVEMLARFFANLSPLHLDASQRRAKEMRARCGRPGRKRERECEQDDKLRKSRARQAPSLVTLWSSGLEEIADLF